MVYLDSAATTIVSREVSKTIYEVMDSVYGNPSSLYAKGIEAKRVLDSSRASIAGAVGCSPDELFFTACGTESNNLAILGAARARKNWGDKVVVTGFEHPSVQNTVESLKDEGFRVEVICPDRNGNIDTAEFLAAVDKSTVLCCAMRVNNETGALIDVSALAEQVKRINRRTAFHCDCVQGFMKHPVLLNGAVDTLSASAHKLHGPKGIGLLYVRKAFNLARTQFGGGQEKGLRSGTENIPYIAGFARAVEEAWDVAGNLRRVTELRDKLKTHVQQMEGAVINSPDDASPYIFNFSLPGYRSETLLHFFEGEGICVSSGSACSHGEKSHTLEAMGLEDSLVDSALRISFSSQSTVDDVDSFINALDRAETTLRRKD